MRAALRFTIDGSNGEDRDRKGVEKGRVWGCFGEGFHELPKRIPWPVRRLRKMVRPDIFFCGARPCGSPDAGCQFWRDVRGDDGFDG